GEELGRIVYGFSSRRLEQALADARARAFSALLLMMGLVALIGLVVLTLGVSLARREAERITSPLGQLTDAAQRISSGDRRRRVEIKSGGEVQVLGDSFNKMVAALDASYATLEERVEERTRELARRNGDLRLVLDTVQQGLLTID